MAQINKLENREAESVLPDNQKKIDHILSNLLKLASGDFDICESTDLNYDSLDAIDRGVVMLGEHLKSSYAEHERSILEKETLLKEIHHRVKNNLQIISSLINLESNYNEKNEDHTPLKESQQRIFSLAMVHDMMYKSNEFSFMNLSEYIENLTAILIQTYGINESDVSFQMELESLTVSMDQSVTLGLLINEVITNSLKHAFDHKGQIFIKLRQLDNDVVELNLGDNGKGFNYNKYPESLGLTLIESLTDQLNGKMERKIENGTKYQFTFLNEKGGN